MSVIAVVPAAGSGSRMEALTPKQYLLLHRRPLIWHTLKALEQVVEISRIAVVLSAGDEWWDEYDWSGFNKLTVLRIGGDTRAESVLNGLQFLAAAYPADSWVLVHDAARPCISPSLVSGMIAELKDDEIGGILAVPVADTLKIASTDQRIAHTQPRAGVWQAQTPQMFKLGPLADALVAGMGPDITDEASAMEKQGLAPRLVHGSPQNIKVTYPQDLALAELMLDKRSGLPDLSWGASQE
ncbi:2-C-methyl-D-erythritol 4-phosphate cytidylyltransferase [Chitinibacteraceae bacterium HSL-7]